MSRSDREFKEELLLRAKEYRAAQRRKRANALRTVSMAAIICVLVVLSQGGAIFEEEWYCTTAEKEAEDDTGDASETVEAGMTEDAIDSIVESTEKLTEADSEKITQAHAEGEDQETENDGELDAVTPVGVTIRTEGTQFDSSGTSYAEYDNPELAEELFRYLSGLKETVSEESMGTPEKESDTADSSSKAEEEEPVNPSDSASEVKEVHKFTICYSDGTEVSYLVTEGEEGCMILDQVSWEQLKQIMREHRTK